MAWNTWKTIAGAKTADAQAGEGEPVLDIRVTPVPAAVKTGA
jgi:hypothetical protein